MTDEDTRLFHGPRIGELILTVQLFALACVFFLTLVHLDVPEQEAGHVASIVMMAGLAVFSARPVTATIVTVWAWWGGDGD